MVVFSVLMAGVLAVVSGSPTPIASATPPVLKTIVTVKSTPFCNSLGQHFNAAFTPMFNNDRTLDHVDTQLVSVTNSFATTDNVQNYMKAREKLGSDVKKLYDSLTEIQAQINQFRDGEKLASDPASAAQLHQAAQELQRAYDKQSAMAFDLHSLFQSMMQYNPGWTAQHNINGYDPVTYSMPAEMKDIKKYLRFDGQRDIIRDAENKAVDITYDIAAKNCTTSE